MMTARRCIPLFVLFVLSLVAAPALAQGKAKGKTTAKPVLKISELTFEMGDQGKLVIGADGKMQSIKNVGEVRPNGQLVDRKGKVMIQVKPDGSIVGPDGKKLLLKLKADGSLEGKKDGKTVTLVINADGTVTAGGEPLKGSKVVGASTPDARRLAAALFAVMMEPGKAEMSIQVPEGATVHVSPPPKAKAPAKAPAKK
jgi:hypothetical protein